MGRGLWRHFVSMRATLVVLLLLSVLLLASIVLPQAEGATAARHAQLAARGGLMRLLLVTAGFGSMATSPLFLGALALFFAQLVAVLLDRSGAILRRASLRPPPAEVARRWLDRPGALAVPRPSGFDPARARQLLERLGYRVRPADASSLWGLKNRTAPLGFLLFHASFVVLCAGAALLYYTREVRSVTAIEGQRFFFGEGALLRAGRLAPGQRPAFVLERLDVGLERGHPVLLAATLRPDEPGAPAQVSRVNAPAEWGSLAVLVERAGIAPVFWLQDERGFTLERIAVAARGEAGTPPKLAGGTLVRVAPIPVGETFPERPRLATVPVRLEIEQAGRTVFAGELRAGQSVALPNGALVLQEVRYWAELRAVDERGGLLLVGGFLAAVLGIAWRMLWYRREVCLAWDGERLRLGGQGEFFPRWFQEELRAISVVLTETRSEEG